MTLKEQLEGDKQLEPYYYFIDPLEIKGIVMDREKEIKYLMYIKSEIIKQQKKELKQLRNELEELNTQKTLKRKKVNNGKKI